MQKQLLMKRSWIEIDLQQLKQNYSIYKAQIPSHTEIMAVVKADAYGHGDFYIALLLEKMGVRFFAVSNIREAILLREKGIRGEILVLGYTPIELAEDIYRYNITQTLLSEDYAHALASASKNRLKAQFAIDTGMNRIGINGADFDHCEAIIRQYAKCFALNGVFTHLCVADSQKKADVDFTKQQICRFSKIVSMISDLKLSCVHCLNSAGGLYYCKEASLVSDYVRLGIVLYGLKPDFSNVLPNGISPILTWKTVVAMVKTVPAGESIGYGRSFLTEKEMRVATLPTGYADGYNRLLSNTGYVLLHGKRAPIIGRVCMDQMMVDVTYIPDVKIGDEVVLIGTSQDETITADEIGRQIGTIGYEIICNISKRVDKIFLNENLS